MLAILTKHTRTHTEKEITYEHKTTNKERKDSEITQYEALFNVALLVISAKDVM